MLNPPASLINARRALILSFWALCGIGSLFLFLYWNHKCSAGIGIARSAVFIICMAALHTLGHRLYCEQDGRLFYRLGRRISTTKDDLIFGLILQASILLLASIMLDNGAMLRFTAHAATGHWGGTGVILTRNSPITKDDRLFIRLGQLLCMGLVQFLGILLHLLA